MPIKISLQRITFGLFTILVLLAFLTAATAQTCPSFRTQNGVVTLEKNAAGECVFNTNTSLPTTLILESNTTLNCQGHRLRPETPGSFAPATGLIRSVPEVAIFLNGVQNVEIKNCLIQDFDFGVFAINSKRDPDSAIPPIQIFDNSIAAHFVGISFMSVDNSEIRANALALKTKGGRAIYVGRDSDRNRILDNTITGSIPLNDATPVFRVPGLQLLPSSNPAVPEGSAVLITQAENLEPSLLNAVIPDPDPLAPLCGKAKCLFQLTISDSAELNGLFTEGNIVGGNRIQFRVGFLPLDGVALAVPQGTRVSKNEVIGAKLSIRVGSQTGPRLIGSIPKQFHGTCNAKPGRFCVAFADCNISVIDPLNSTDTCLLPPPKPVFWVSHNTIIQDNEISGAFDSGIVSTGENTMIISNEITGPTTGPLNGTGIRLAGKSALETTTVTRNSVRNVAVALHLTRNFSAAFDSTLVEFRARIFLNDFTKYATAVRLNRTGNASDPTGGPFYDVVSNNLSLSELSFELKGNFWDKAPCALGFDPLLVRNFDAPGSVSSKARDSHPFVLPVADGPDRTPCR